MLLTELLAGWRIPPGAHVGPTEAGSNNHTFRVTADGRSWCLRISQNMDRAQVLAEHRLLARLRRAGLSFAVPTPEPRIDGGTVADSPGGPVTLCAWIPGVRPDLGSEPALERFGRAAAELSTALAAVAPTDAPFDWRGGPLEDVPDVTALARDLMAAGLDADRAKVLRAGLDRALAAWAGIAGRLPQQVVHADLAPSNVLVAPDTGEVTGILDFEVAGYWLRAIELTVALALTGSTRGPDWPRRAAALTRGGAWGARLTADELHALPDLIVVRAAGSTLWRSTRWRRGQSSLAEVAERLDTLAAVLRWRSGAGAALGDVVAGA
ncbi:phosphotransferase enzyme family protein [Dactylosporangium sp. NPDC051541]|uniref:phosphotransferase enzyme family protein n=1 Tax=Dactylosporangium sp. NPDC051541 TaxID=3363977 RepID=UPI0037A376D9